MPNLSNLTITTVATILSLAYGFVDKPEPIKEVVKPKTIIVVPILKSEPAPVVSFKQANINTQILVDLTNKERASRGLAPLTINPKLVNAAKLKGEDMLKNNYWAHTGPQGQTAWTFISKSGYGYIDAGENLARGFGSNMNMVHNSWVASPTHMTNIIDPRFKEIGIYALEGNLQGKDTILIVQIFGNPL